MYYFFRDEHKIVIPRMTLEIIPCNNPIMLQVFVREPCLILGLLGACEYYDNDENHDHQHHSCSCSYKYF